MVSRDDQQDAMAGVNMNLNSFNLSLIVRSNIEINGYKHRTYKLIMCKKFTTLLKTQNGKKK